MLKQLIEFAKQMFSLTRKTQQHEEDIKGLRQELAGVEQEISVALRARPAAK